MKPRSQTTKIEEVRARLHAVYAAIPVFDAPFEEFYRKLRYQTREVDAEQKKSAALTSQSLAKRSVRSRSTSMILPREGMYAMQR